MTPPPLLLEGGAEFSGRMSAPDLRALQIAGGLDAPVCIIPAAAAPDANHKRAGAAGQRWFHSLGARHVFVANVIDSASANDAAIADSIRAARLIFLLGGFPRHLGETLAESLCWTAALEAHQQGAVIAGSSAGAMVLCQHYYDPYQQTLLRGLNLLPNACILPHHNTFGKQWAEPLTRKLPDITLLGIDEATGIINDDVDRWRVYGGGTVTVYQNEQSRTYSESETFNL